MQTSHDAAIACRAGRYDDAVVIYNALADHARILRKKPQVAFYEKLAKETKDISVRVSLQ